MKILPFVILLSVASLFASGQGDIDVLHYMYRIGLNDQNDSIVGQAMIVFRANENINAVNLDLINIENGKGMYVYSAGTSTTRNSLQWTHQNNKLTVPLKPALNKGDTTFIFVSYRGIPSDGLIISKNKFGKRTFFSDNWPDRAHYWIPCNDRPDDKASFEFLVTAPSHYRVVSNGVMVEEKILPDNKKLTHWKEDVPLPTKVMVIGVADFAVDTSGMVADSIPVTSWVFPENKKDGFYDYAIAKSILQFFINYIGPYPFKKLANVQSKTIYGGMENAGAIFYHENSVVGHREEEMLISHEIVHQWFGDMASEKNYSHLWLSEGFATYLTHIYTEATYGQERFLQGLKNDREEVINYLKGIQRSIVDSVTPRRQLINTNNYARAGWVLHMLRRKLGDSVFHKGIQAYYETFKGKNALTEDLQQVFEKVSRKNLDTFFRQWLYRPDIPKLDIKWKYNPRTKKVTVTVVQFQDSPPFQFLLEVRVQGTGSSVKTSTLRVSKAVESFSIPVKTKPVNLTADPNISLLFEGKVWQAK